MGVPVFKRAGDPADPAVLLVHGYPASSHMWRPALEALAARGLHALAPDLAGFGDSPPGPGGTNIISRDLVPPDWNVTSKHEVAVTKDGPNKFDFDIP